jgi:hypothetical protein
MIKVETRNTLTIRSLELTGRDSSVSLPLQARIEVNLNMGIFLFNKN